MVQLFTWFLTESLSYLHNVRVKILWWIIFLPSDGGALTISNVEAAGLRIPAETAGLGKACLGGVRVVPKTDTVRSIRTSKVKTDGNTSQLDP